jgi:broad specificity phosphatase PhoE
MSPRIFRYLSHPQVKIDPEIPVPQWGLSDIGRARTLSLKSAQCLINTTLIVSSAETKAQETAAILADDLSLEVLVRPKSHENDRSATGFLKGKEFERTADQFFAYPEASVRGWERAVDAQARIVQEAQFVLSIKTSGDILMIGHGGVGTLLFCHFAAIPIGRIADQPPGGGNFWSMDASTRKVLATWQAMEGML